MNLLSLYNHKYVNSITKFSSTKVKELTKKFFFSKTDLDLFKKIDYFGSFFCSSTNPGNIGGIHLPPLDLSSSNIFFIKITC